MPLNDSFNKRGGPLKVAILSAVPTADDITFSLSNAQKNPRKPVYIAWQVNDEKRMLAVTCGMNPYTEDARWVLRDGHQVDSPIIWTHESADALMIHTLVSDSVNEVGPAASIPDFLRPSAAQDADNNSGVAAADKDYSSEARGSIFAQRYEIIDEIGKGATSTVYRAKQIQIGRVVALKVMHPHMLREEVNKKRFEQEAKATAALSHPNLVLVQDYGMSPLGRPFIVMDYVDGPSLDTIFANQGRLTSQQFLDVFIQCCKGLAHAHKRGVIHRDIKPSNIRLYKDEHNIVTAKILDFGIAKLFTQDEEALKMTETGAVMGSPAYMSPEQSRAEQVDHRTDIYSLGIVMFQAATGYLPFKGKDIFETLYKHIYEQPPSFASLELGFRIPNTVEAIIQKTLQKDPAQRYQNMEELQQDLSRLLAGISNSGALPALGSFQSQSPPSQPPSGGPVGENMQPTNVAEGADTSMTQNDVAGVGQAPIAAPVPTPLPIPSPVPEPTPVPAPTPVPEPSPVSAPAPPTTELDLLKAAKVITDLDIEKAREITARHGGQVSAMLIADGKLDRSLLEVAKRCTTLINAAMLDIGRAVILLNFSQRSRLDFDKAVEELGWNLS
ncbi:MAG: serine/threonine-protein kinase [Candidatus Obscuribacterales bacterium]